MNAYYVDGHFICADTEWDALNEVARLYGHAAGIVRPWTDEDQAELAAGTP